MKQKHGIPFFVSVKAQMAFIDEADKENYTTSGMFREFLRHVADKYDRPATGIRPGVQRETKRAKNVKLNGQIAASFSSALPGQLVEGLAKKNGFKTKSAFLRAELLSWLNGRGYDLTEADIKPEKKPKRKKQMA